MRKQLASFLAILTITSVLLSQEEKKNNGAQKGENPKSAENSTSKVAEATEGQKKLSQIQADFVRLRTEAMKEYMEAKTNEEKQALIPKTQEKLNKIPKSELAKRAFELGKSLSASDPASIDSLVFAINMARPQNPEIIEAAGKLIVENHVSNPKLSSVLSLLSGGPEGVEIMEKIASKTANKVIAAQALLNAGQSLQSSANISGATAPEIEKLNAKAEKIFERIVKDYSDIETGRATAGEVAKKALFEIQNLSVGKKAPEVTCLNIQGDKDDKLSNYLGKVVVIDIWATWCGPCRAMIPHEREMVSKLQDKPFALISVSGDDQKETLTNFLEKEKMPWIHWFADRKGILKDWNIRFYPTIYVIDHKGVIRAKGLRGEELEKKVTELIAEIGKEKKS